MKVVSERSGVILFLDSWESGVIAGTLLNNEDTRDAAAAIYNAHTSQGDGNVFEASIGKDRQS